MSRSTSGGARRAAGWAGSIGCLAVLLAMPGCEREARRYQELPASANRESAVRVSQLEPGAPQQAAEVQSPYQRNAWGMGEGKRLYAAYNCAPCHGVNGGGAIGPPLIDDKWIYGAGPIAPPPLTPWQGAQLYAANSRLPSPMPQALFW